MKKTPRKRNPSDSRTPRQLARECAVQAIYQWMLTNYSTNEIENHILEKNINTNPDLNLFILLFKNSIQNIEDLKKIIKPFSSREDKELSPIVLAILYLATYEIIYQSTTPVPVILNEAVVISKKYASPEAYRYVNGVLQKIADHYRIQEFAN